MFSINYMIIQMIALVLKILFIYVLDGNYTKIFSDLCHLVCEFINETLTCMQVNLFKNEIKKMGSRLGTNKDIAKANPKDQKC